MTRIEEANGMPSSRPAAVRAVRTAWRDGAWREGVRAIPEEVAIAFTYNGGAHAVMMATPADLQDFAVGFSLTEGVVSSPREIERIETIEETAGIELRMWLPDARARALTERRRHNAGPTGCGLCGIESLSEAVRTTPVIASDVKISADSVMAAMRALGPRQALNHETRAVHAAAFWQPGVGIAFVREDVGRHNALDKLCGALARADVAGASGLLLMTSRVSVELIQKAAIAGMPVIAAVSAPTALAVRTADAAGITLIAIVRDDGFEVFTHTHRIAAGRDAETNVA